MVPPERRKSPDVRIGHPSGSIQVQADVRWDGSEFKYLCGTVYRTARRIMDGVVYVPEAFS
jgi:2-methylaconitate cis-trans-isomerase PrpF